MRRRFSVLSNRILIPLVAFATLAAGCAGGGGGVSVAPSVDRGGVIAGTVTDPASGAPLAGASVTLAPARPDPASGAPDTLRAPARAGVLAATTTDAAGRYEFRDVPEGEYDLVASTADGLGAHLRRAVRSGAIETGAMNLTPVVTLTGRVTVPVIQGVRAADVEPLIWLLGTGFGATGLPDPAGSTPSLLAFTYEIRGVPVRAAGSAAYAVKYYCLGMTPATMSLPLDTAAFASLGGFVKSLPAVALDASPDGGPSLNLPPLVLSAGSDLTVYALAEAGATAVATLTASASDPDGDPLTYRWTQTAGPAPDSLVAAGNPGRATLSRPGRYTFLLTVRDDAGGIAQPVSVSFEVTAPPPPPPVAVALRVTVLPGATVDRPFAVRIEAIDAAGLRVDAAPAVTLAAVQADGATPAAEPLGGTTGGTLAAGLLDLATVTYGRAETIRIKADTAGGLTGLSGSLAVAAGAAASLRVTGPATAVAGAPVTVTIHAVDAAGNPATGYSGDRAIVLTGPAAGPAGAPPTVLPAAGAAVPLGTPATLSFTAGVASASVTFAKAESCSLDAADGSLSSAADPAHDLDLAVEAGPVAAYRVEAPAAAPLSAPFPLTVAALDAYGNLTRGASAVTLGATAAGTPGVTTCDLSAAVAAVTVSQTFDRVGPVAFTAVAAGASGQSLPVTISAAPANLFAVPAANGRVRDNRVDYTLGAAASSGTITWSRTGGTADPASPHVAALAGAELAAGRHPLATLANNPPLVAGAIYSVTLATVAAAGGAHALPVTVANVAYDATDPAVTSVASPAPDGTYVAGATIDFTVTFTEPVAVDNTGGTPALALDSGGEALYLAGGGTATLTFRYLVSAGDASADLAPASTGALALHGGVIRDAAGNPASLVLPDPALFRAARAIRVDAQPPRILHLSGPDGFFRAGQTVNLFVIFSESMTLAGGSPALLVKLDNRNATVAASGLGTTTLPNDTLVFPFAVQAGDAAARLDHRNLAPLDLAGATLADAAGNSGAPYALPAEGGPDSLAGRCAIAIDTAPPTFRIQYFRDIALTDPIGDNARLGVGTYHLRITASEPLAAPPAITIDAEGSANDVAALSATAVAGNTYRIVRAIAYDALAVGALRENIALEAADPAGNFVGAVAPLDAATKAAFPDTVDPAFTIDYFADAGFATPLGVNPRLKAGVYHLRVEAGEALDAAPTLSIDAEGTANDVFNAPLVFVAGTTWRFTRTVLTDPAAAGITPENHAIACVDGLGYYHTNLDPTNEAIAAAFPDTAPPTFAIQYFSDVALASAIPGVPRFGVGTWYLRVTASEPLAAPPEVTIDAEGTANDLAALSATPVAGTVYRITRAIAADAAAVGATVENLSLSGTDLAGNAATLVDPTDEPAGAGFTDTTGPSFSIRYFSDAGLTVPLAGNPLLGPGTYHLAVTASEPLAGPPSVTIDAEGSANDVTNAPATLVSGTLYKYTRTIAADALAVGAVLENVSLYGVDTSGNVTSGADPTDEAARAAFTDTVAPTVALQYFSDVGLTAALPDDPRLAEGTWYVRLTASEALAAAPVVSIDAEGSANDLAALDATLVSGQVYRFTRTVGPDVAAVGAARESVTVAVQDLAGNAASAAPADAATKAAFTDTTPPSFAIQYFSDPGLTASLGDTPRLKAGTYHLKITASEPLAAAPDLSIDAEGSANDVATDASTLVAGNIYVFTRTIAVDAAAVGAVPEDLSFAAYDLAGNAAAPDPTDEATKAAITDTTPPAFTIQYFADGAYASPLPDTPRVGPGTYYLEITSNEPLVAPPTFTIDAPGGANDVAAGVTTPHSGNVYRTTRTVLFDAAADGSIPETLFIDGTDLAGNAVGASLPVNAATAALRIDTGGPTLASWSMDMSPDGDAKNITLVFSEPVAASSLDLSKFTIFMAINPTIFAVLDASIAVTQINPTTVRLSSLASIMNDLGAMTSFSGSTDEDHRLEIEAGGFTDAAGNPNEYDPAGMLPAAFVRDLTSPRVVAWRSVKSSPDLAVADALEIEFSDYVRDASIEPAAFTMREPLDSPDNGTGFSTAVASIANANTPDDRFVTIFFTPGNLMTTGPKVASLTFAAVADLGDNLANPTGLPPCLDKASPVISSSVAPSTLDAGANGDDKAIVLAFSEPVDAAALDPAKVLIQCADGPFPASVVTLEGAERVQDDVAIIRLRKLGPAKFTELVAIGQLSANGFLFQRGLSAGAVGDAAGNASPAIPFADFDSILYDETAPTVVAAHSLDLDGDGISETLELSFDDYMDDASLNPAASGFRMRPAGSLFDTFDAFSTQVSSVDVADVVNDLHLRLGVVAPVNLTGTGEREWDVDALTLTDLAGIPFAPSTGPFPADDRAGPRIVSWDMDMAPDGASKKVRVVFSENLEAGQSSDASLVFITDPSGTAVRSLAGANGGFDGAALLIEQLGGETVAAIDAIGDIGTSDETAYRLTLATGAVVDAAGNPSYPTASPIPCALFTPDASGPNISSIDAENGLIVFNDYMASASRFDFQFTENSGSSVVLQFGSLYHDAYGSYLPYAVTGAPLEADDRITIMNHENLKDFGGNAVFDTGWNDFFYTIGDPNYWFQFMP